MAEFEFMRQQHRDFSDRIITLLEREKSVDLTGQQILVRVIVSPLSGKTNSEAAFAACVRDFFVDRAEYIDAQHFVLQLMPMCGNPDGPKPPRRQMGELYRLEVDRDEYLKVPYIPLLGVHELMYALEGLFGVRRK